MFWNSTKELPSAALADLRERIRGLDDDIHQIKRDLKGMQVDWDGTFSKFQALYARLAKQARKAEERAEEPPQETNGRQEGVKVGQPGSAKLAARFRRF